MHGNPLNPYRLLRPTLFVDLERLDLSHRGHAVVANDLAEDGVQPVQVRSLVENNEKLAAVGARALVGHGHDAALAVFQGGLDLIGEGAAPDGAAALGVLGG